jgi:hypothetical protein
MVVPAAAKTFGAFVAFPFALDHCQPQIRHTQSLNTGTLGRPCRSRLC